MNFQTTVDRGSLIAEEGQRPLSVSSRNLLSNEVVTWCDRGIQGFSRLMGPTLLLAAIAGT
ncbi:MAG: hypothetical protein ABW169_11385, partial [Sphingobium sp.]